MTVLQTSSVTSLVPTHLKFPCGAFVTLIKTTRGLFHQLPPPAAVYLFSPFVCNESDHSYGFISRSPSFYLLFCIWYLPPAVCLSSTVRNVNSGLIIMPRSCPCVSEQRCKLGDDTATGRLATSCFVSLSGCLLLQQNGKCVMWLFLCVDTGAAAMTLITELLVLIINYVHYMILDLDHLTSTLNVSATRMQQSGSAEITVCLMDLFMVIRGSHVVEKSLDWQSLWLISGLCLHLYLNDTPLKFYDCIWQHCFAAVLTETCPQTDRRYQQHQSEQDRLELRSNDPSVVCLVTCYFQDDFYSRWSSLLLSRVKTKTLRSKTSLSIFYSLNLTS